MLAAPQMLAVPRNAHVDLTSRPRASATTQDPSRALSVAVLLADLALWLGMVPAQVMQTLVS